MRGLSKAWGGLGRKGKVRGKGGGRRIAEGLTQACDLSFSPLLRQSPAKLPRARGRNASSAQSRQHTRREEGRG